jgi:hypothetical protein
LIVVDMFRRPEKKQRQAEEFVLANSPARRADGQ